MQVIAVFGRCAAEVPRNLVIQERRVHFVFPAEVVSGNLRCMCTKGFIIVTAAC